MSHTTNCGCTETQETTYICNECQSTTPCDCPIIDLSSDCVLYTADTIQCQNVDVVIKNTILSVALKNIVDFFCQKFSEISNRFRIVNIGTGAKVYKQENLLGQKELRTITSEDTSVTIVEGTSTIDLKVTTANPTASNVGTGAGVFKELSSNDYKFRKIKTENSGTGATILKTQVENTNDISLIAKSLLLESQGTGTSLIKDLQANTDDNKIRLKSISSTSLNITTTTDEISIEVPVVVDIPALIVNSAYTGVEELGTASKPFKTIQGALDAYVGTGGRGTILDPSDPELLGSIIQIEKGIGTYNFTGDFDYKNLQITLNEGVRISSTPISGWLMDFNLFNTILSHKPIIVFSENAYITCNSNGFKLIGVNLPSTGTSIFKQLSLKGIGEGGVLLNGTAESDILFEVDGTNLQYENSGYSTLEITSRVSINRGRMFVINGKGIVNNKGNFLNILNNINDTITNTYPTVKLSNNAILKLSGSEFWIGETLTVTYSQLIHIDNASKFEAIDTIFRGSTEYFAYNNTIANIAEIKLDSCKMYITTDTSFAGTVSGVWGNINLTNNNMPNTSIDNLTTSILPSATNIIGGQLLETLSSYASKALAVVAGLKKGGAFINRKTIIAGAFIVGLEYKINTIGTTDFTLIGAASNTVGLYFTASGVGTGDGTAFYDIRDTVM